MTKKECLLKALLIFIFIPWLLIYTLNSFGLPSDSSELRKKLHADAIVEVFRGGRWGGWEGSEIALPGGKWLTWGKGLPGALGVREDFEIFHTALYSPKWFEKIAIGYTVIGYTGFPTTIIYSLYKPFCL